MKIDLKRKTPLELKKLLESVKVSDLPVVEKGARKWVQLILKY